MAFPPPVLHGLLGFALLLFVSGWIFIVLVLFDPPLRTALKDVTEIIRNVLLGLLGVLGGAFGLYLAFVRSMAMRESAEAASRATAIADRKESREKDSTAKALTIDSLTRAIEQLGNDDVSVRLGGIHALDRLARSENAEVEAIAEVLAAHVRQASSKSFSGDRSERHLEIQLCINKLGSYRKLVSTLTFDLRETDLRKLDFIGLDFTESRFDEANLSGSYIEQSAFTRCSLSSAVFQKIFVLRSDFAMAKLGHSKWTDCRVEECDFSNLFVFEVEFNEFRARKTKLFSTRLWHAKIINTNFDSCNFDGGEFTSCEISETTFEDCSFVNKRIIRTTFQNSFFDAINAASARISGSVFNGCRLNQMDVDGASFSGSSFNKCGFRETSFDSAAKKPQSNSEAYVLTDDDLIAF
jgi:uncharacterized protein YjbI with pentapeptide repeats